MEGFRNTLIRRIRDPLRAVRNLSGLIVFAILGTVIFSYLNANFSYSVYYGFVPGQYNGHRLLELKNVKPNNTCVILGVSTAREGFEIKSLSGSFPDINFVTFASTASTSPMHVVDLQARTLRGKNFKCVILGLHSYFIGDVGNYKYELVNSDYLSQLHTLDILRLIAKNDEVFSESIILFAKSILIPNFKHSKILDKHIRRGLFEVLNKFYPGQITMTWFEKKPEELAVSTSHYRYDESRKEKRDFYLEKRKKRIVELGLDNPSIYSFNKNHDIFMEMVKRLHDASDRIIELDLPETSVWSNVNKSSEKSFHFLLEQFQENIELYKCSINDPMADKFFVDSIHLDSTGRKLLTEDLIKIIKNETASNICKTIYLAR